MLLSVKEVAAKLGVTRQTVYNWLDAGHFFQDASKVGGHWVIHWTGLLPIGVAVRNGKRIGRPMGVKNGQGKAHFRKKRRRGYGLKRRTEP